MDYYDEIYYSLIGQLTPEAALPWVPNVFQNESDCEKAYARLCKAKERLLARLRLEEDADLEIIIAEMEWIQRIVCRQIMQLRKM